MPELRGRHSLKIAKLFEEPRNLENDCEKVFRFRRVVHIEQLEALVVLDHWVVVLGLQHLPVAAQVVFGMGVEQEQKCVDLDYSLLQTEEIASLEVVVCNLLQDAQREVLAVNGAGYGPVDLLHISLIVQISLENHLVQKLVGDPPEPLVGEHEAFEEG